MLIAIIMLSNLLYEGETFVFEDADVLNVAKLPEMIAHHCV